MSSSSLTSASVAGQQQISNPVIGNRTKRSKPSLSLHIHQIISPLSMDLGTPFSGSDFLQTYHLRSHSLLPRSPFSSTTSVPQSASHDGELESTAPGVQQDLEDEQCILIEPTSPFYHPPSRPRFSFSLESMSMACEQLSQRDGQVARMFHEKLAPYVDDKIISSNVVECLKGVDEDLHSSPLDVFEEMLYNSTRPYSALSSPSIFTFRTSHLTHNELPDMPDDVESDELDFEDLGEEDSPDSEGSYWEGNDSHYSANFPSSPRPNLTVLPPSYPFVAAAAPDKRVVAPFDYLEDSLRVRVVPRCTFLSGMFMTR